MTTEQNKSPPTQAAKPSGANLRLTQLMRSDILSKAMGEPNKAFQKRVHALEKREHVVALKCYNSSFSPAIRGKCLAKGVALRR